MNRILAATLIGTGLAAAALPVLAQGRPDAGPRHGGPARLLQMADADKDGRVSETEALNALSARFAEADADKDGGLTRAELSSFLRAQWEAHRPAGERRTPPEGPRRGMQERIDSMFRAADANRDGRLTMDEARPIALALFRAADKNNDGVLEASELRGGPRHGPRPARAVPPAEAPGQPPVPAPQPPAPAPVR